MLVKAHLVRKFGEIIRRERLTQTEAAKILGLTQPRTSLGRDVDIVVKRSPRRRSGGRLTVVFS